MAQLSFFHSFILYCAHLIVTLASPNLGCASTIKIKIELFILYCIRLSLTLASPKVLTLDNKNKKKFFRFVLSSLNRTFALKFENC